jgi:hypothetical protein
MLGARWIKRFIYPPPSVPPDDIDELAQTDRLDAPAALKDLFTWRRERGLRLADGAFKISALILTPLLAAVLSMKAHLTVFAVTAYSISIVVFWVLGLVWMARSAQIERTYGKEAVEVANVWHREDDGATEEGARREERNPTEEKRAGKEEPPEERLTW